MRKCINSDNWNSCNLKHDVALRNELCVIGKLVITGTRIIIPQRLRARVISLANESHLGMVGTKQNLSMVAKARKRCREMLQDMSWMSNSQQA